MHTSLLQFAGSSPAPGWRQKLAIMREVVPDLNFRRSGVPGQKYYLGFDTYDGQFHGFSGASQHGWTKKETVDKLWEELQRLSKFDSVAVVKTWFYPSEFFRLEGNAWKTIPEPKCNPPQ